MTHTKPGSSPQGPVYRTATILSDIHGIAPALKAVLAFEAQHPSDVLIVAGDTAAGPQPNEVVEILRQHQDRLVAISGNGDREIIEVRDGKDTEGVNPIFAWAAQVITEENLDWLRALPPTAELDLAHLGRVHICHATPQNDLDIVLVDTRIERWNEVFADLAEEARTVVLGHTHMPFQRLVAGRRVINPGSIGMPYGRAGAHWTRIGSDGAIETHITTFDADAALDTLEATSTFPNVREWATPYLKGHLTDIQALETFGPKDGRSA
jgi:putative phosphoesterase